MLGLAMVDGLMSGASVVGAVEPPAGYVTWTCGNQSGKILLTFDDWNPADPYLAMRIGADLKSRGIRAIFFLINEYAKEYPDIVAGLRQAGHYVGNHSWSHRRLSQLSDADMRLEISRGVYSNLLRPPNGDYGARERDYAASIGYRIATWHADLSAHDWETPDGTSMPIGTRKDQLRTVAEIRGRIRDASAHSKGSAGGGVILGHLWTNFPDAVPGIISDLKGQGYGFVPNTGPVRADAPFPFR